MYKEKGKTLGPLITNNIDRFSAPVIFFAGRKAAAHKRLSGL
jgi:hypothetical protein